MGNFLTCPVNETKCPVTKCPENKCQVTKCPENKCPEMKEGDLYTVNGWFEGSTNSHMHIPVNNVSECRQIADWNKDRLGLTSYTYRRQSHPQDNAKNTCILRQVQGDNFIEDPHHVSGCIDNTKNVLKRCV